MKQNIYVLASILFIISGCRRHVDPPGGDHGPTPDSKLRLNSTSEFMYVYDSQGRLSKSLYSNSLPAGMEYVYTDKTITGKDVGTDGKPYFDRIVYTLGSNGLAVSDKYVLGDNSTAQITNYTYNTDRQLVEEIAGEEGKAPVSRTVYYYNKGNRDSLKTFSLKDGKLLTFIRFEYYTDKPAVLTYENNGITYLGASNANLLKKYVQINPGDTTTMDISYVLDAQNRPVKGHFVQNGLALSDEIYTYIELP
ncbi:MAG: hypothetical protein JST68_09475 [Bacteroidetes bacterium]|nr:hypothetical protein [Bacteroidota bacterium]